MFCAQCFFGHWIVKVNFLKGCNKNISANGSHKVNFNLCHFKYKYFSAKDSKISKSALDPDNGKDGSMLSQILVQPNFYIPSHHHHILPPFNFSHLVFSFMQGKSAQSTIYGPDLKLPRSYALWLASKLKGIRFNKIKVNAISKKNSRRLKKGVKFDPDWYERCVFYHAS